MYASGLVFEAQGAVPEAAAWDDSAIMKVGGCMDFTWPSPSLGVGLGRVRWLGCRLD